MSTSLYWEPVVDKEQYLGKDLKWVLAPLLWEHDGSLSGSPIAITLDYKFWDEENGTHVRMQDFLVGLSKRSDDTGKEAQKLLKLLSKHVEGIFISLKG